MQISEGSMKLRLFRLGLYLFYFRNNLQILDLILQYTLELKVKNMCVCIQPPFTNLVNMKVAILGPISGIRADYDLSYFFLRNLLDPETIFSIMAPHANKDNYFDTGSLTKAPRLR